MPVLNEDGGAGAADDSGRQRCSCLPAFCCLWGAGSAGLRPNNKPGAAQAKKRRRRRLRFRLRLSSWLAWPPWFRRSGKGDAGGGDDSSEKRKRQRRCGGRRLLLLLTTSLQFKKALASVVSGDSTALLPVPVPVPVPAKVRRLIPPMVDWSGGRLIDRVMGVIDHDYSTVCSIDDIDCVLTNYFTVSKLLVLNFDVDWVYI